MLPTLLIFFPQLLLPRVFTKLQPILLDVIFLLPEVVIRPLIVVFRPLVVVFQLPVPDVLILLDALPLILFDALPLLLVSLPLQLPKLLLLQWRVMQQRLLLPHGDVHLPHVVFSFLLPVPPILFLVFPIQHDLLRFNQVSLTQHVVPPQFNPYQLITIAYVLIPTFNFPIQEHPHLPFPFRFSIYFLRQLFPRLKFFRPLLLAFLFLLLI